MGGSSLFTLSEHDSKSLRLIRTMPVPGANTGWAIAVAWHPRGERVAVFRSKPDLRNATNSVYGVELLLLRADRLAATRLLPVSCKAGPTVERALLQFVDNELYAMTLCGDVHGMSKSQPHGALYRVTISGNDTTTETLFATSEDTAIAGFYAGADGVVFSPHPRGRVFERDQFEKPTRSFQLAADGTTIELLVIDDVLHSFAW